MKNIMKFVALICLIILALIPRSQGQTPQTIDTMWRCGACNENQCKPFTMVLNQCTQICSPCTGTCATEYYLMKPNTATTYTLDQYSGANCLSLQFSHFVEPDSCKTSTAQCSLVYLPNSAQG